MKHLHHGWVFTLLPYFGKMTVRSLRSNTMLKETIGAGSARTHIRLDIPTQATLDSRESIVQMHAAP